MSTIRVRPAPAELVSFGNMLAAQAAAWFIEVTPEATLHTLQLALTFQATSVETIRVSHAVRLLRQVAERQSIKNSEEGFRLQLQQDSETFKFCA